jgi:hypothetical protein
VKNLDPTKVFLSVVLLARDPKTNERVILIKIDHEPYTHEGKTLSTFHFTTIDDNNPEYSEEAKKIA